MKTTHSLLTTLLLLSSTLAAPVDFAALGNVQDKRDYSASEFPSVQVPTATTEPESTGGGESASLFPTAPGNCGVATATYTFTYTATQLATPTYPFTYTATQLATPTYPFTYTATQLASSYVENPAYTYTATQLASSYAENPAYTYTATQLASSYVENPAYTYTATQLASYVEPALPTLILSTA
jgi:hypothetical protein